MAYIGHPVAGDAVYGPKNVITELGGQCLHARLLGFDHPVTGERIELPLSCLNISRTFKKNQKVRDMKT